VKTNLKILIAFLGIVVFLNSQAMHRSNMPSASKNFSPEKKREAESIAQALSLPALIGTKIVASQRPKKHLYQPQRNIKINVHIGSKANGFSLPPAKGAIKLNEQHKSHIKVEKKIDAQILSQAVVVKQAQTHPKKEEDDKQDREITNKIVRNQSLINLLNRVLPSADVQRLICEYAREWSTKPQATYAGSGDYDRVFILNEDEILARGDARNDKYNPVLKFWKLSSKKNTPHHQLGSHVLKLDVFPSLHKAFAVSHNPDNYNDQLLSCYDTRSKNLLFSMKMEHADRTKLHARADGIFILALKNSLFLLQNDKWIKEFPAPYEQEICCVEDVDGKIVAGYSNQRIRVWDIDSNDPPQQATTNSPVRFIRPLKGGQFMTVAFNSLYLYDLKSIGKGHLKRFDGHRDEINAAINLKDGTVATASTDWMCKRWFPDDETRTVSFKGHSYPVTCLAETNDGLLSGSVDHTIRLWNINSGESLKVFNRHSGGITNLAVCPDGNAFLSASTDETIKKWSKKNELESLLDGYKRKQKKDAKKS
jgi:WD40 repeat protein